MQTLWQDLRYGVRMLFKQPGFTLIAVVTLALGIGANTAIFSVVNAVLLRALPWHNAERLVILTSTEPGGSRDALSLPEAEDFKTQMRSLEDLTGVQSQSVNLTGGDRPDRVRGAFVTSNFFQFFHLTPIIGRTLAPGEDQRGAPKVVVINEKFWRERLNGEPHPVGKKLMLNGEPYDVIGVIPSGFQQPLDAEVEVWLGAAQYSGFTAQRDFRYMVRLGRLKPEATLVQAQAEAGGVASQLAQAYPKENAGRGARVEYFRDATVGDLRCMLLVLLGAVGVILLIACVNLANLLLARSLARQKEIAVRVALGAGRWRLMRQLLTETTLLGLLGGAGGLLLAAWGLQALLKLPQNFVRNEAIRLDAPVLMFALAISIVTGWLFGLAPALQLAKPDLHARLKEGGRSNSNSGGAKWNRLRSAFVVVQVAASLLLLVTGGLLIRSFDKLLRVNPGFKPEKLLTMEYRLPRAKYAQGEAQWNFHRQVVERIAQTPGVTSAALIDGLPFSFNYGMTAIVLLDRALPPPGQEPQVTPSLVTPGYFGTMGIPLVRGRLFDDHDQLGTPFVYLINQTMARHFWPDQDPIGKQIKLVEDNTTGTVIGVVGDTRHYSLEEEARPQMYSAYSQRPNIFVTVVARTAVEPMSLADSLRQAVWKVDSEQPMWKIRTVEFLLDQRLADRRFVMTLMSLFAAVALALTVIGLYGVLSYTVRQRTPEIGLRMALGAGVRDILRMVLRQGLTLVLIGVTLGLIAAWLLTRLMGNLLYGVSATDPLTFATLALLLTLVALVACWIPARRATQVDPLIALRCE